MDELLIERLQILRSQRLPNETGGVFLGSFDLARKIVYIVDTISSPSDSTEWPILYIRGSYGLSRGLERAGELTAGRLQYIGEWHSHPDGFSTNPSLDDQTAFQWLSTYMSIDGYPAIMVIVGRNTYKLYVDKI